MLQHFGPLLNPNGAAVSLTYIASERTIPGTLCCLFLICTYRCTSCKCLTDTNERYLQVIIPES